MKTIYIRLFDVDYDDKTAFSIPVGEAFYDAKDVNMFEKIVPTIFITNRALVQMLDNQIDTLAKLIYSKINVNMSQIRPSTEGGDFNEIQIDCDWTETTRDKFFNLLKQIKKYSNKKLSATIRLHQIKFRDKTGVPPVDRAILMAYNMGNLDDIKTENSILDINTLKSYTKNLKSYPLTLDIALPLFNWGVVIRDGETVKLIPNFSLDNTVNNRENTENTEGSGFIKKSETEIQILKNGYYNGLYLYADDRVRIEQISLKDLQEAADILSQNVDNQQLTLSFFSLDSTNLSRYNYEDLSKIVQSFK